MNTLADNRYQPQWAVERRHFLVNGVIAQDKVRRGTMRIGCLPNVFSQCHSL